MEIESYTRTIDTWAEFGILGHWTVITIQEGMSKDMPRPTLSVHTEVFCREEDLPQTRVTADPEEVARLWERRLGRRAA